jgi:hypothetical protein
MQLVRSTPCWLRPARAALAALAPPLALALFEYPLAASPALLLLLLLLPLVAAAAATAVVLLLPLLFVGGGAPRAKNPVTSRAPLHGVVAWGVCRG